MMLHTHYGLGDSATPNAAALPTSQIVYSAGPGYTVVTAPDPKYTAPTSLPWTCTWFGMSCPAPPVPYNAAPQTQAQMTQAGAWTPDMAISQSSADYQQQIQQYFNTAADSGVANVQTGLLAAGNAIAAAAVPTGLILLGVGVLALIIVLKVK